MNDALTVLLSCSDAEVVARVTRDLDEVLPREDAEITLGKQPGAPTEQIMTVCLRRAVPDACFVWVPPSNPNLPPPSTIYVLSDGHAAGNDLLLRAVVSSYTPLIERIVAAVIREHDESLIAPYLAHIRENIPFLIWSLMNCRIMEKTLPRVGKNLAEATKELLRLAVKYPMVGVHYYPPGSRYCGVFTLCGTL